MLMKKMNKFKKLEFLVRLVHSDVLAAREILRASIGSAKREFEIIFEHFPEWGKENSHMDMNFNKIDYGKWVFCDDQEFVILKIAEKSKNLSVIEAYQELKNVKNVNKFWRYYYFITSLLP